MSKSLADIKPFLALSPDLSQICEPLRAYGIIHFCYLHNFNDGTQIKISEDPLWVEHYYLNDLQKTGMYEGEPEWYQAGYSLWSSLTSPKQELEVIKESRDFFGGDHGITICKKHKNSCEFFFFVSSKERSEMLNFYLNNLDLLERFILYFKDKGSSLIEIAYRNRIKVADSMSVNEEERREFGGIIMSNLKNSFVLNKLNSSNIFIKGDEGNAMLTSREWGCLRQLLQGKRIVDIADSLFISSRTAEKHLDSMRVKFNCASLTALVVKVLKNNHHLL